uniref:Uncharacterized protein AlNc14C112G6430 n=1 Tax=Albugo laibachii Nc14 TaxID=890382 RepID=F0WIN1_9STRA|nr:conserved hypothetical protein [Albugo laibachii Nc14]|eukprot:CCA21122.1 conserved hypothetical protein [Albugo laibachii Nc14]
MDASAKAMPILFYNMGSEMMYIINERLRAQKIPSQKSVKVLEDLVRSMHNNKFRDEIFQTQKMPNTLVMRQLFERLVHSSIMRLNVNSMDKLYDLMRMVFKFQMLSCSSADKLLKVTMTHLDEITEFVAAAEIRDLIADTKASMLQMYGDQDPACFFAIKQRLCRFFQDLRINVSLLLQSGLQSADGTLVIRLDHCTTISGHDAGTIQYLGEDGSLLEEQVFKVGSGLCVESPETLTLDRHCLDELGKNMYAEDRVHLAAFVNETKASDNLPTCKHYDATALDGINLLASLVGSSGASPNMNDADCKPFRVSLFKDLDDEDADESVPTVRIDALSLSADYKQSTSRMIGSFDDQATCDSKSAEADDLISLMDSVSK